MTEDSKADALTVEAVSHAFGGKKALDDVSLEVPRGGFVALLGINGAGKTTLFSLVTRLYDNISGSIKVCGFDVRRKPGPALARLGVVFQSRALDRDLTIRQNMAYHAALQGMPRRLARERSASLAAEVGLADRLDSKVATLSGGQVRRAEIARSLMHKPTLLLLDEPTVGLDVKSRREVVSLVRKLVKAEGVAALWATHLFDEIEDRDAIVVLHKGQVLARTTAQSFRGDSSLSDAFLAATSKEAEPAR